jgi:hypothetical protein
MKLSRSARHLRRTGIGYRTEKAYGEGYREAGPVIEHEVEELGNEGQLDEIQRAFRLKAAPTLEEALGLIERRYGKKAKAIWFATKRGVRYYGDRDPDIYKIPKKARIIADLGTEGQLFLMRNKDFEDMMTPDWLKEEQRLERLVLRRMKD